MEYLQAVVLGVVQGITEFIPISSDGHLFIVREVLNWPDQGLLFDAVLHMGTLIAIVLVLWRDLVGALVGLWHIVSRRSFTVTQQARLATAIIVATIPAALAGYFFEDLFTDTYRNTLSVGLWFAAAGAFYFLAEQISQQKQLTKTETSWGSALIIGLAQVSALLPGVSRSGTTIATGTLLGLTRESAARFSFVMATPIIAGASALSLLQLMTNSGDASSSISETGWLPLILGTLVALVVGVVALKGLLSFVKKRGLRIFGTYLLVIGGLVIALSVLDIL